MISNLLKRTFSEVTFPEPKHWLWFKWSEGGVAKEEPEGAMACYYFSHGLIKGPWRNIVSIDHPFKHSSKTKTTCESCIRIVEDFDQWADANL